MLQKDQTIYRKQNLTLGFDNENLIRYPHIGINEWPNLNKKWDVKAKKCKYKNIKTWFNYFEKPNMKGYSLSRIKTYTNIPLYSNKYKKKHLKKTWTEIDSIIKSKSLPNYKNIALIVTHIKIPPSKDGGVDFFD